jgi:hypothetical protein
MTSSTSMLLVANDPLVKAATHDTTLSEAQRLTELAQPGSAAVGYVAAGGCMRALDRQS